MLIPRFPLRAKLIVVFSLVIVIGVFISTLVGINLIGTAIIRQAQDKVRLDLNSAREVYKAESDAIKTKIRLTADRFFIKDALYINDHDRLRRELQKIRERESLDILTLTDDKGMVLVRAHNTSVFGDRPEDDLVDLVRSRREPVVATMIVSEDEMVRLGATFLESARIDLIPTPKSRPSEKKVEQSGMFIKAAAPVFDYSGRLIGVLFGGNMLNRDYDIVDRVKNTVYLSEMYKGRDIGTATIFLDDARISTNVMNIDGERAVGTRVSKEVYDQVVVQGKPWIGRAFVVNAWYMTAYEPIRNVKDEIIGMLYVGMLEAPYVDLRNRVVLIFWSIAIVSVILLSIIASYTTSNIIKPIKALALATEKVASGDMTQRVEIDTRDEIGFLGDSFNQMTAALQEATDGYQKLTRTLEEKVREKTEELRATQDFLIQSERLASLGKLAAGVAHEINNPLTSILLNSHLILERFKNNDAVKENLELIINETTRCSSIVSGLLEFARQTPPEKTSVNINKVIESTLLLMETQALVRKVRINKDLQDGLPELMVDLGKIKQVFTNIVMNAIDAMPSGGVLRISSRVPEDTTCVEIVFEDNGKGIPQEHLQRIFDPFFTTKGTKGTGLGLSISYGIIQQHSGRIDVESKVGKGTKMTIYLPLHISPEKKKEDRSV
ncbi:MAG: cache domain-containing protein [candidate division WOR-3 bacterium]|nr:MAG: cache domain-containing protein [candidate division WOR-3 bacterium]